MALRGRKLDEAIEKELQIMNAQGHEQAPISAKLLHERLTEKGEISGGLSTLSKPHRKELIALYKKMQLEKASLSVEAKIRYQNNQNKEALKAQVKKLKSENEELKLIVKKNTSVLMSIIEEVHAKTPIRLEHLLSEHLIMVLNEPESIALDGEENF